MGTKNNNSFEDLLKQVSAIVKEDTENSDFDHVNEPSPCGESLSSDTKQHISSTYYSEESSLDYEQRREIREHCEDTRTNRELRKEYASKVFVFMCAWCVLVFLIIILDALTYTPIKDTQVQKDLSFQLSPPVITTLIGGTTVSVIGLVGFMMQGLFHSNGSNGKRHK